VFEPCLFFTYPTLRLHAYVVELSALNITDTGLKLILQYREEFPVATLSFTCPEVFKMKFSKQLHGKCRGNSALYSYYSTLVLSRPCSGYENNIVQERCWS